VPVSTTNDSMCFSSLSQVIKYLVATTVVFVSTVIMIYRHKFDRVKRRTSVGDNIVVGFFHPNCSAGGGGERVLWKAIQALGELREVGFLISVVIYTFDSPHDDYSKELMDHVNVRFSILLPPNLPLRFVHLNHLKNKRRRLSMIAESAWTMRVAWAGLNMLTPHIFFDTTGCAFTFIVAKILGGCKIATYVHYPTISTDMLKLVWQRRPSYNNQAQITQSVFKTYLKFAYYTSFAIAYGVVGCLADVVMTNSSWTYAHIHYLWRLARNRMHIVYPPCNTNFFQNKNDDDKRENIVISIGQVRTITCLFS